MKFKFLFIAATVFLAANTAQATPEYDEKMEKYQAHLKDMRAEAAKLDNLVSRFDESSKACLNDLEAGGKGLVCMHMKKDKMDFEYEYKTFKTYNRIRKVPKFERALQGMMEREMFRLPKAEAAELFKTHMSGKSNRQADISNLGEKVYSAIERFNTLSDERLDRINDLKKK